MSTMLPNTDEVSGSAYMKILKNVDKATYLNKTALPILYGVPPIFIGDYIFYYLVFQWLLM